MHASIRTLVAAGTFSALAAAHANPAAALVTPIAGAIAARQIFPQITEPCSKSLVSIATEFPLPKNTDLISWYAGSYLTARPTGIPNLASACAEFVYDATPPASLTSAYSSFTSSALSWASENKSKFQSLASSCGGTLGFLFEVVVATNAAECSAAGTKYLLTTTGSDTSKTSSSSSSTTSGSITTAGPSSNLTTTSGPPTLGSTGTVSSTAGAAGPKETAFVVAVAYAVVAAGAMAVL